MPHLSKRILEPEVKDRLISSLEFLVKDLNNLPDTHKFLTSILSETERMMIAKRIVAAFLLRHNVGSESIQDTLKLTGATVGRLKLWIQTHQEGFNVIFDKLEKQRRSEAVKAILYGLLDYAINASFGKTPNPFKKKFKKGELQ